MTGTRLFVFETVADAAAAVARRVADAVRETPDLVLGLPAGQTAIPVYAALRALHATGSLDCGSVRTFTVDEFAGLALTHPASFCRFVSGHLLDPLGVPPERRHFLDGAADDADAECRRYEEAIAAAGGIGLQLLGIGANGHIGFNEPGEALAARTHRTALHDSTRRANAALFGGRLERVPHHGLTMGMGTLLRAHRILLVAAGPHKAAPVAAAFRGPITTRVPASMLQLHRTVEAFLDSGAAAGLRLSGPHR